jgi:hypothetical protein
LTVTVAQDEQMIDRSRCTTGARTTCARTSAGLCTRLMRVSSESNGRPRVAERVDIAKTSACNLENIVELKPTKKEVLPEAENSEHKENNPRTTRLLVVRRQRTGRQGHSGKRRDHWSCM